MISTTGGGVSVRGNSRLPRRMPWPVSRLTGRWNTVGAAWAKQETNSRRRAARRGIIEHTWGDASKTEAAEEGSASGMN